MGLYVVWSEVRRLGGFIRVESSCSLGTAFHVYLPAYEEVEEGKKEISEAEEVPFEETVGSKRILMVEDNLALRSVLADMLKTLGHQVEEAGSVREALHLLERIGEDLDMVISDVDLPDGDGYKLIKEICSRFPHVKPVIMTGYAEAEVVNACRSENIPVLYKPFSMHEIQKIFSTGMEKSGIKFLSEKSNRREQ